MHLSNVCIDPIINRAKTNLRPRGMSVEVTTGAMIFTCALLIAIFLSDFWLRDDENMIRSKCNLCLLHLHMLLETDFLNPLIPPMGCFKGL